MSDSMMDSNWIWKNGVLWQQPKWADVPAMPLLVAWDPSDPDRMVPIETSHPEIGELIANLPYMMESNDKLLERNAELEHTLQKTLDAAIVLMGLIGDRVFYHEEEFKNIVYPALGLAERVLGKETS